MSPASTPVLEKIYMFPFKGLPAWQITMSSLKVGIGIPTDRRFAITRGTVDTGEWMNARSFYINAVIDGMSKFKLHFDGNTLHLENIDGMKLELKLDDPASLDAANNKIIEFLQPVGVAEDMSPPQIIDRKGKQSNWDYFDTPISIINAESVKAISEVLGEDLDPLRFRGNLVVDGLTAWEEFSWMGKRIKIGDAELEVHRPIDRCPTPGVNPETGERDVEVTPGIQQHFGHIHCGMYARVVKDGEIKQGDEVTVLGDGDMDWQEATAPENASDYALWPRTAKISTYDVRETITELALESATPWPLPKATAGQRLRLHLGPDQWTVAYISDASANEIKLEIEDSKTGDPLTEILRDGMSAGQKILISGPFGKTRK